MANPKDPVAEGYHYNAAVIYDGMNAYTAAVKNYELYFQKHRGRDKFEVLFLIAKIYERTNQKDKAISQYNNYIMSGTNNAAGIIEAHYTIAKLHEKLGRIKVTEEWWEKTVAVQRRLGPKNNNVGASFAAEGKFKLVSKIYNELVAIRIPANPARQAEAVKLKLGLTNRLKDQLKSVIAYDDGAQIVAALSLQGQALQHMYNAILTSPVPGGLKPEELKQYQEGEKKIADPFKEQAIETYTTALQRGHELQGYNNYLKVAAKNLNLLKGNTEQVTDAKAMLTQLPDWMDL